MALNKDSGGLEHISSVASGGKDAGKKQAVPKKNDIPKNDAESIRRRLIIIRTLSAGNNLAEFARQLGVERNRWSNMENGHPLTLNMAFTVMKKIPGITIEYIIDGSYVRLRPRMKRDLQLIESALFQTRKPKDKDEGEA